MKRKFLILTLCFTIIFSSINYNKSYADGGVISLPILATVGSLAVASGISLSGNDDIYDIGRLFFDYVNKHNDLTWDMVKTVFYSNVAVLNNGLINVKSGFLDIVKSFFNDTVNGLADSPYIVSTSMGLPFIGGYKWSSALREVVFDKGISFSPSVDSNFYVGDLQLRYSYTNSSTKQGIFKIYLSGVNTGYTISLPLDIPTYIGYYYSLNDKKFKIIYNNTSNSSYGYTLDMSNLGSVSIPYVPGSYNWDDVESKKENDSIALPIPGDLGQLVGQGSTDFWDNTDGLVGNGDISIPSIDNPSIEFDDVVSFPDVGDVPDIDVPDTDVPDTDVSVPSFPSFGDSLDFSPMYLTNVTEKFPFSLPWDLGRLMQMFDVYPVAPVFDVPVFSETITLDLTDFSELAAIVRFFVLIAFILSLIFISTRLMG